MDFTGYKYVATFMVLAEIAVIFLTYRKNPKLAIYATLVSIVLKGQYLWVGRAIFAWQFSALLGIAFLVSWQAGSSFKAGRALGFFRMSMLLYYIYTVSVSVPLWLVFSAEGLGTDATGVSLSRVLTQLLYFGLVIGLYGFGARAGKHLTTFNLLKALIIIAAVAAYFALFQVLVVRLTGLNIFPIIGSDNTIRSAYIMDTTFRATSFTGEPKHLGLLMSVGLISFFLARLFRIPIGGRFVFLIPLVMATALLMSLSTTGMAIAAAGIGLSGTIFFRRLRKTDLAVIAILVTVLITQVIGSEGDFSGSLEKQILKLDFEVQDESVRLGLMNNPSLFFGGTGLGNIHLIAVDYLPENFPLFRDHGYKANSGLFFVMGDSGLIGLLFLICGPLFAVQAYAQNRSKLTDIQRKEALTALALLLVSLLSFLMRYDPAYFLFSGFVFTRLVILRHESGHAQDDIAPSTQFSRDPPKPVTS